MNKIKSQPLRWHGGKSDLARWIHSLAPAGYTHRNIVYAGGLGEFWNWEPVDGISESVNDLDGELMNFWGVLKAPGLYAEFVRMAGAVPFANAQFEFASGGDSQVDKALDFFVRYRMSRQGLGKCYATPTTRTRRGMNENVSAWLSAVDGLPDCHERLRRVELRNMDAIEFIEAYDHPKALFYLDPPYMHSTRKSTDAYGPHEMTALDHVDLLNTLTQIKGKFMLSGYHSTVYDAYAEGIGWHVSEREVPLNSSSKKSKERKIEVIWTNYQPTKGTT